MVGSLVTLFVALLAGSLGVSALQRYVPGFADSVVAAYVLSIPSSDHGGNTVHGQQVHDLLRFNMVRPTRIWPSAATMLL